jgi:predicted DNA-binding protein YlxM (UPF0122 family)
MIEPVVAVKCFTLTEVILVSEFELLDKTNRINLLFDFYDSLLTEKQQTFLRAYFHDDYSLGEIAAEYQVSRQAIYEHIKRAEQSLEDYEHKLQLLARHERRTAYAQQAAELLSAVDSGTRAELERLLRYMVDDIVERS